MNEKVLIPKAPYNFKRIISKICMTISKQSLLPQKIRKKILKLGGENWKRLFHRLQCGF